MKMQKLVYIVHGYALVECEEPVLNEVFEAWKFGPVLNTLYHECKVFGKRGINRFLKDWNYDSGMMRAAPIPTEDTLSKIIRFVWENYGDESAESLSDWTHERGGPWDQVTCGGTQILRHQEVPNSKIEQYFRKNMYGDDAQTEASVI